MKMSIAEMIKNVIFKPFEWWSLKKIRLEYFTAVHAIGHAGNGNDLAPSELNGTADMTPSILTKGFTDAHSGRRVRRRLRFWCHREVMDKWIETCEWWLLIFVRLGKVVLPNAFSAIVDCETPRLVQKVFQASDIALRNEIQALSNSNTLKARSLLEWQLFVDLITEQPEENLFLTVFPLVRTYIYFSKTHIIDLKSVLEAETMLSPGIEKEASPSGCPSQA